MTNRKTFILIQDDSCHWYLIPSGKQEDFEKYIDSVVNYDYDSEDAYPEQPEWVVEVDGPHSVLIENYSLKQ
jgi:hypothetical protein